MAVAAAGKDDCVGNRRSTGAGRQPCMPGSVRRDGCIGPCQGALVRRCGPKVGLFTRHSHTVNRGLQAVPRVAEWTVPESLQAFTGIPAGTASGCAFAACN